MKFNTTTPLPYNGLPLAFPYLEPIMLPKPPAAAHSHPIPPPQPQHISYREPFPSTHFSIYHPPLTLPLLGELPLSKKLYPAKLVAVPPSLSFPPLCANPKISYLFPSSSAPLTFIALIYIIDL